jgi:hypothetical protein
MPARPNRDFKFGVRELAPAFGAGTICGEKSGGKPPHSKAAPHLCLFNLPPADHIVAARSGASVMTKQELQIVPAGTHQP